ncbi:MAG TPA: class II aldolase/adducin family protein, partial [Thermoanaerobaculia bacterium]|nr:class II aldolase/adducin family protein [Thermoanaerobaculia bacterium]
MFNRSSEDLVGQSRLVGANESLVLWGGGNNSMKTRGADILGREIDLMLIKSSGSDMKTITPAQFPAVRLDYIAPLRHRREDMTDQEMVNWLARCLIDPGSARPSIETLLHAFLPVPAVLHTHADAILSLTNSTGREKTVLEALGDDVITIPYRRPGFLLSREVGEAFDAQPDARAIVLMNHGLITWGETPQIAYERHIELVEQAERFLVEDRQSSLVEDRQSSLVEDRQSCLSGQAERFLVEDRQSCLSGQAGLPALHRVAPILRGALSDRRSLILEFDDSQETLAFCSRDDLDRITQIGAATPDHLLYTKRCPLVIDEVSQIPAALEKYDDREGKAYERQKSEFPMLDPAPRVVLVRNGGMFTAGKDARAARIVRDIYRH